MSARIPVRAHRHVRVRRLAAIALLAAALPSLTVTAASASTHAPAAGVVRMTPALVAKLSTNVNERVIVLLRQQLPAARIGTHAMVLRTEDSAAAEAPLLAQVREVRATNVLPYGLVDAFAATVSHAEATWLSSDPAVRQVIPDVVIHGPSPVAAPSSPSAPVTTSPPLQTLPGACSATTPQLTPEGLDLTHTDSDTAGAQTARSRGITGAGVKVAYIADGVDPANINFIRANSTSAFADYQDFTGDGPGQITNGDEAFLDANTIAGQGIHTYDVSTFSAQADPTACNIRIEGVAPGASLVGLDVFGSFEDTTESNFLQAINYAVVVDHVDVLNESFGSNPFPDVSSLDATDAFNNAAVAAGVTVVVSSGDAGPANTIGSPSSDPSVISVGASTQFRFYAQTNEEGARYFTTPNSLVDPAWINNNISSLSSSGFDETGSTIDLVAPGDLSWASCDASPIFVGCVNPKGQSSDVESAGGTSESAPFVSGAAALVIQAYRATHGNATPAPALVKEILVSTASDLHAPANEQGAGLLDSYRAVELAQSIPSAGHTPAPVGLSLLKSVDQLHAEGLPHTLQHLHFTITNLGSVTQTIQIRGRTLGPDVNVQTGSATLTDGTSPQFTNFGGIQNNYATFHFHVPVGQSRLSASLAYPGNPGNGLNARVRLLLIDPFGRLANTTLPQGVGNAGTTDVVYPWPGTWTGVLESDVASDNGTNGTVEWRVATQSFASFASISPHVAVLTPHESLPITVTASTPSMPGDQSASITFRQNGIFTTTLPLTLRSYIDLATGGTFSGTLTGGNGRSPGEGQQQFYEFSMPPSDTSLRADVSLSNDAGDPVGLYLVAPDGSTQGMGQNQVNGSQTLTATASVVDPAPGTWTLIVDFASPIVGDEVSQHFTGSIKVNQSAAAAPGLPDSASTTLSSGTPVTVPVTITNHSGEALDFFIDPRLTTSTTLSLAPFSQASGLALPLAVSPPIFFVPTDTSSISPTATASLPIEFDFSPFPGDPDLWSSIGTAPSAEYTPSGGVAENGFWGVVPSEVGPYSSPAPAGTVSVAMTATALAFDSTITSSTGDVELASTNPSTTFSPVVVNPGASAVVGVTITPSGGAGTVVEGTLYVDSFLTNVPPYGQQGADQVAAVPYEYTIGG